jgi:CRISPR-associated endonuclease Cas2
MSLKRVKSTNLKHKVRVGKVQKKILLTLMTGVALGLSGSPTMYFKILKAFKKDWDLLNTQQFTPSIEALVRSGLITCEPKADSTLRVRLTKTGWQKARGYQCDDFTVERPKQWDGYWHVVTFDIPVRQNRARNALRFQLKRLGFVELQRSVFAFPYEAREVIDRIAALFDVFDGVVYMRVSEISHEAKLKKYFRVR